MKYFKTHAHFINEARRGTIHSAAKKASYPVTLVATEKGKVVDQKLVGTPMIVPAAFNEMQKEFPNAKISVESKTGETVFIESVINEFGPMAGSGNRNYSTNDLIDRIGDLDDILTSDRKAEREWEEMSQNYLDGQRGSEYWGDLGDQELQDAIDDAESLMKKYRIKESVNESYKGNFTDFKYDLEMAIDNMGISPKAIKAVKKKGKGYEVRLSSYMSDKSTWEKIGDTIGATLISFKPGSINIGIYESVNEAKFFRLPAKLNAMWELKNAVDYIVGKHERGDDYKPAEMKTIEALIKKIKGTVKSFTDPRDVKGTFYESAVTEGGKINLKADHLSSSEYQKAKKLKAFNANDWVWNSNTSLYDRVGESVVTEDENTIGGLNKMANTDLERIADYADMIKDRMSQGQTLDAWMYSKISDSVKSLNSVHDTMDGNDGVIESLDTLCEATVEMDTMDPGNKDFLKFLKKNRVKIISKEMQGPGGGNPVITMQGKRKDLENVLADEELGWGDADLAEFIEESLNEAKKLGLGDKGVDYNDIVVEIIAMGNYTKIAKMFKKEMKNDAADYGFEDTAKGDYYLAKIIDNKLRARSSSNEFNKGDFAIYPVEYDMANYWGLDPVKESAVTEATNTDILDLVDNIHKVIKDLKSDKSKDKNKTAALYNDAKLLINRLHSLVESKLANESTITETKGNKAVSMAQKKLDKVISDLKANLLKFKAAKTDTDKETFKSEAKRLTKLRKDAHSNLEQAIQDAYADVELVVMENYDTDKRKEMAEKGLALPDGSFPIKNLEDLKNAIQAYGRSKDQAAAAKFIAKRAKALGAEDLIPDTEDFQKSLKEGLFLAEGRKTTDGLGKEGLDIYYDLEIKTGFDKDDIISNFKDIDPAIKAHKLYKKLTAAEERILSRALGNILRIRINMER